MERVVVNDTADDRNNSCDTGGNHKGLQGGQKLFASVQDQGKKPNQSIFFQKQYKNCFERFCAICGEQSNVRKQKEQEVDQKAPAKKLIGGQPEVQSLSIQSAQVEQIVAAPYDEHDSDC